MTLAVKFCDLPSGRLEVRIGSHVVGTIYPPGALTVRYSLVLPGIEGARNVDSVAKARRCVLRVLADWFDACGPEFAPIAAALAAQSDAERVAA